MRVLVSILFSAVALFAENPQAFAPNSQVPDNLSIPAKLSKTIDTNKCKAGDVVEMKTLEPVLIANGLVMPESAKLHGRILGAASRQNDQPSWLVLVVERAEWKQHSIPLHAFVAAQITIKTQLPGQSNNAFQDAINLPDTLYNRHTAARQSAPGRGISAALSHALRDATVEGNDALELSYHGLNDLRLMKDQNGRVFLVSQKPHLKLPSGTMFMLRNQATVEQTEVGATKAAGSAQ